MDMRQTSNVNTDPSVDAPKSVPLTCSGHTRPVVHLEFSDLQDDGTYTMLSSCKDGNPM